MTGQGGKYTVIELSESLGVARTTINDWLTRYSQYIDFAMQGRRKIYTDASIAVLKEISDLRNSGLSSFDIEAELAKRHPVRGEPQIAEEPPKEQPAQEMGQRPPPSASPSLGAAEPKAQAGSEEFALMAKRQTDEIGRMIGESFQNMAKRMEEIEKNNREANARASRWYVVSLILVILIIIAGFIAISKMDRFAALNREMRKQAEEKDEKLKSLQDASFSLVRQTDDLKKNVEALEKGMVEQKAEFDKSLQEVKTGTEEARRAEVGRLRNNFAAERLELLKKLESVGDDAVKRDELLKELRQKLSEEESAVKAAGAAAPAQ